MALDIENCTRWPIFVRAMILRDRSQEVDDG